jgi:hypothetical protein
MVMPIIGKKLLNNIENLRIKIPSDLKGEITEYCQAFEIADIHHFFEEAARFVLKNDKVCSENFYA